MVASQGPKPQDDELERLRAELKRTQQRLLQTRRDMEQREVELRLRERAVNSIQSGIVICDAINPLQPIIYVNHGFEQMTGYTAAEAVGKNCRFLQGESTDPAAVQRIRQALQDRQDCVVTLQNYRRDGTSFWNELRLAMVEDEQRNITHFVGILHDVTEQVQSERFLRRVLNSLFAFAGVCTPDGILVEANRTALEAAGLEAEDVLGQPFADTYWWAYDPEVQESLRAAIRRAANGQPSRYDVKIRIAENQLITIDFQIVPMRDDHGAITHLIPSAIDITQRLRDQERVTVLGAMAEQSNDFISIFDLSGQGLFLNAAGRELVGFDQATLIEDTNVRQFFFEKDLPKAVNLIRRVLEEGQASQEMRFRHFKTGEPIDVLWDVFRIDDPTSGEPFAMGTITQDIRQQKADKQRLIEARKKADAANRSKTEFLANMSHEIRTPMTAILGYADLLGEQLERPEDQHLLETIQDNGKHLLQIINDILDLSKIESGKLAIAQRPCSPAALVQEIGKLMQVRAADKRLQLLTAVGQNVPEVIQTDPLRIKQILINLVGNAIKFTDAGEVRLQVEYDPQSLELCFAVSDTGIGIDAASQRLLFEPFTQVDGSDTRSSGGTGLGLAISRRLAERLGGELSMESQLGVGSTFTLRLTVPEVEESATVADDVPPSAATTAPDDTEIQLDCRVLVVDDRQEIRFLAERILTSAGAEVVIAETAEQTLAVVEQAAESAQPIEVVLTDIQMPRMDGYELARRLRQQGFTRPIIALTAHALQADLDRCLAAGCDAYASKPLDRQQLLRLIAQHTR
ncbi:PAS domain S-box protein [Roseimaritima ulvae]|uniref:histidine kinase n=1 Tax=Roseimaritima ulvae TaxID=980254 RepID=A0A5B9R206_9BACT|nr:PAS domain S-box protein [Roseimaritima ulvae]QEG40261.1 Virulence sensor protein BvgS precursor [Roseimaritima ulvae]